MLVSSKARVAPPTIATAGASRPLSGPTRTDSPSPDLDRDRPPVGADAGVDHGEHHAGGRSGRASM